MHLLPAALIERALRGRDILLRDFGLETLSMRLFVNAREFHLKTPKGWLWFDLESELSVHFFRLREFLRTISFDQVKEYVDLRIADKVVYR